MNDRQMNWLVVGGGVGLEKTMEWGCCVRVRDRKDRLISRLMVGNDAGEDDQWWVEELMEGGDRGI